MFSWFKKAEVQIVSLPGEVGTFEIPRHFAYELEEDDDSTLVFFEPDSVDDIVFRISSLSVEPRDQSENAEFHDVQKTGREKNLNVSTYNKTAWYHEVQEGDSDGEPLLIHFWHIGSGNTVIILSATVIKSSENSSTVTKALAIIQPLIESLSITKVRRHLENEDGKVSFTEEIHKGVQETRRPMNSEEKDWLQMSLRASEDLSRKYGSGGELNPKTLDVIFARWMHEEGEKEPGELIADSLGAAFGDYMVQNHGFSWTVISDQYGTEFAVEHGETKTTGFPRASVEKRIDSGEEGFFDAIQVILLDTIKTAARKSTANE